MTLLSRAKRGASGNEATNRETKPNWMTGKKEILNHQTCAFSVTKHHYILLTHLGNLVRGNTYIGPVIDTDRCCLIQPVKP